MVYFVAIFIVMNLKFSLGADGSPFICYIFILFLL